MGNGASNPTGAVVKSTPHARASSIPPAPTSRTQKVLVNAAPRASADDFRSRSAITEASVNRRARAQNPEARSASLQQLAVRRRQGTPETHGTGRSTRYEEDALLAFTRNADPISLRVLELVQQVDAVPKENPVEKLRLLRDCYPLLESVPKDRFDQLAVTVYQKEGDIYYQQEDTDSAKSTYSRAIMLAERRVARQGTDMYMVLKRYVLAMVGLARIWYHHERDHEGFTFVDHKHPKVPAVDGGDTATDRGSSMSSLENSLISDGGSVFSLNEAILKSMAPRPPRRQTGPLFQRVKMHAPHVAKMSQFNREDEFVLHSRMTRELVASPCELLLLRCCEVVQIGHNSQSELLIPAQIELAQIYEDLELYSRALLLVRRCVGILCSVFDYDHPWVVQLMQRAARLGELLEEQTRNDMATKIQSTWKMYRAVQQLENALGHPVRRHQWVPRKYRMTPDIDFLRDYVKDMPANGFVGSGADDTAGHDDLGDGDAASGLQATEGGVAEREQQAMVPRTAPGDKTDWGRAEPHRPGALVGYAPTQNTQGGDAFMTVVRNATVVGTTQDSQTDTLVEHTEYGDVLTVRTTTVTKTITEDLVDSDDDVTDEESSEYEEPEATPLLLRTLSPDLQQQHGTMDNRSPPLMPTQRQYQPTPPPPPPPPPPAASQREEKEAHFQPRNYGSLATQRRPPVHKAKRTEAAGQPTQEEDEPPRTSRQFVMASPRPQQHELGMHPIPDQSACHAPGHPPAPPASTQQRHLLVESPPLHSHNPAAPPPERMGGSTDARKCPYSPNDTPSLVPRVSNSREAPVLEQQSWNSEGPPSHLYSASEEDELAGQGDELGEAIPRWDSKRPSSERSRSHVPGRRQNSSREQFPHLVQPHAVHHAEASEYPVFLPHYNRRGSNGSNRPGPVMQPQVPKTQSSIGSQSYQSELPVYPSTQSSGHPPVLPNAVPQARMTKKTTNYRIIKTRRVRTYAREPRSTDSTDGEITRSSSGSVHIEGDVSSADWEEDSASVGGSGSHVEGLEEMQANAAKRGHTTAKNGSTLPPTKPPVKATRCGK
ncbi:hypothetical protein JKF63_07279 [Porcisia hertigi]|uniref:Uncharacterized protein n=1 Tax=Porcisia hertigi TaxID=2761500 RepID=A0A836YGU6_9TRYP|nr:hypothetical protein JKF63_07279 [Porcisia hertigi]